MGMVEPVSQQYVIHTNEFLQVLMMSVRESLPQIWSKIGGELDGSDFDPTSTKLPPITLCTSSWFMSGFIGSLPTESVLRVWDCLF